MRSLAHSATPTLGSLPAQGRDIPLFFPAPLLSRIAERFVIINSQSVFERAKRCGQARPDRTAAAAASRRFRLLYKGSKSPSLREGLPSRKLF